MTFQKTGDLRKHEHKLEGCQGRAREGSEGQPKLTEDVTSCAKPQHRQVVFFKPTHCQFSVILDPQEKNQPLLLQYITHERKGMEEEGENLVLNRHTESVVSGLL